VGTNFLIRLVHRCWFGFPIGSIQQRGYFALLCTAFTMALRLLAGTKLITLHRGQGCYLAVSTHNTDGIVAVKAAGGVLLASFNRPTMPTVALPAVQEACAVAFKRKRSPGDEPDR
jgi:hypothetical protein